MNADQGVKNQAKIAEEVKNYLTVVFWMKKEDLNT